MCIRDRTLTEMGETEFTTVSTTGTLACAVSAAKAETDSEQSIRTASRRENNFCVLILTIPPLATNTPVSYTHLAVVADDFERLGMIVFKKMPGNA